MLTSTQFLTMTVTVKDIQNHELSTMEVPYDENRFRSLVGHEGITFYKDFRRPTHISIVINKWNYDHPTPREDARIIRFDLTEQNRQLRQITSYWSDTLKEHFLRLLLDLNISFEWKQMGFRTTIKMKYADFIETQKHLNEQLPDDRQDG